MEKRILYVVGDLDRGGAEQHICQILPELQKRQYNPSVYTLTHKGVLAPLLETQNIPVFEPPFVATLRKLPAVLRKPSIALVSVFTLWRLILQSRPEIIHFYLPYAYIFGGICSLFTPVNTRIMSRRSLSTYSANRPLVKMIERMLHKKMDCLIGNSRAVVEQLKRECDDHGKIRLIYNGVETGAGCDSQSREQIRKEQGINDECILITMVANIIPYKGHKDLINAIHQVNNNIDVEFAVFCVGRDNGPGDELRRLAERLGVHKIIHWLGEKGNVREILCASDIGVLCSHEEGFSNSILEKMATGLPLVVTDVGGNSEAVVHGVNGLVVPPRDPEKLSAAILDLVTDREKRQKFGAAGKIRAEEKFSVHECVTRYMNIYESFLG